jgi:segregation and condensation protein B
MTAEVPGGAAPAGGLAGGGIEEADRAIEAIVLVAEEPVPPSLLAQLLEIPVREVERRCASLAARYEATGHGFELVRVAGGYRFQTHPDLADFVERYLTDGTAGRLSPAALETLAIVAYKQPVSRAQITAVRGVSVDGVVRTLTQRGLVAEVGRDPGPGQAVLYGTTTLFLERLGLDSLGDLPPLGDFVPGAEVVEALEDGLRAGEDPRRSSRPQAGADGSDPAGPA